ncbi:PAS domain-containing sensor histidine kinase [Chitinivorax sp. B]|uniref:PAS domain-containing sensor histidine kinase n=1 Tax=Chitinivorax sp. B TaxID=2502235 RepID=UPI001484F4E8|nr:PAS domain-containing sensor histidine kinase [Chitinivorax sp. B]
MLELSAPTSQQISADGNETFRAILDEATTIAVQGYDAQRRVTYWNKASETFFGFTTAEALGHTIESLVLDPTDHTAFVDEFEQILNGRIQPKPREYLAQRKDGSRIEVYSTQVPITLSDGRHELYCIDIDLSEIKELERELGYYYTRLRALSDASTFGILGIDPEGYINYANVNLQRITNRTAGELLNRLWYADLLIDDSPLAIEAWENAINKQQPTSIEARYPTAEGQLRWLRYSLAPLPLGDGRTSIVANVEDISDRKQMEQALLESVEKFETTFRLLPDLVVLTDLASGNILDINDQVLSLTGYQRNEVLHEAGSSLTLWIDTDIHQTLVAELNRLHEVRLRVIPLRRKDGTIRQVEYSASTSKIASHVVMISVLRDITDNLMLASQLHESRTRFEAVFDLIPELLVFTDLNTGEVLNVNRHGEALLGYSVIEMVGKSALDLGIWVNPEQRQLMLMQLQQGQSVQSMEAEFRHRNGHTVWVELSAAAFEQCGRMMMLAAVRDVTERHHLQTAMQHLNTELEQRVESRTIELKNALTTLHNAQDELIHREKLATLGSLVAGISHELNTPIGNAVTVASLLEARAKEMANTLQTGSLRRSEFESYISATYDAVTLLLRNLGNARDLITSFKQVAVDQTSEKRRPFDLKSVLEEVLATLAPRFKHLPYRLSLDLTPNIAMDSFPGPLGQVLTNLVNNALLHAFEERTTGTVYVIARQRDSMHATLIVRDNGIGIPPENMNKIWDPFFTTKLGSGGSGLGLNIVYNIVTHVLGGQIKVESQPRTGTCFTLTLPLSAPLKSESGGAA